MKSNKRNLASTPSYRPSTGVGSAAGPSVEPCTTRKRVGEAKIEHIARHLMGNEPKRLKTLPQAVAFVVRHNIEKVSEIYMEKCTGPDSHLTELEYVEKQVRLSATELIFRGVEAAPGKDFSEKLEKVLALWPWLGERWLRER